MVQRNEEVERGESRDGGHLGGGICKHAFLARVVVYWKGYMEPDNEVVPQS